MVNYVQKYQNGNKKHTWISKRQNKVSNINNLLSELI